MKKFKYLILLLISFYLSELIFANPVITPHGSFQLMGIYNSNNKSSFRSEINIGLNIRFSDNVSATLSAVQKEFCNQQSMNEIREAYLVIGKSTPAMIEQSNINFLQMFSIQGQELFNDKWVLSGKKQYNRALLNSDILPMEIVDISVIEKDDLKEIIYSSLTNSIHPRYATNELLNPKTIFLADLKY